MATGQECSVVFSVPVALVSGGVAGYSGGFVGVLVGFGVGIGVFLCFCLVFGVLDHLVLTFSIRVESGDSDSSNEDKKHTIMDAVMFYSDIIILFGLPIGVAVVTVLVTIAIT